MIYHVCGRLGSGKTLYAVSKIIDTLVYTNKEIYTNVRFVDFWDYHLVNYLCKGWKTFLKFLISPVDSLISFKAWLASRYVGRYHFIPDLTQMVDKCFDLGPAEEGSRLFCWDEIQLDLNAREWKTTGTKMLKFFSMSRKLGFDVLIISQLRSSVDRQLRDLADVSYELKNLKHFRPLGIRLFPEVGILVKRWANKGLDVENKTVFVGAGIVRYNDSVNKFYDTKQIVVDKQLEQPKIWYTKEKYRYCNDCVYLKYYYEYADFVSLYFPGRKYEHAMPKRLLWFNRSQNKELPIAK